MRDHPPADWICFAEALLSLALAGLAVHLSPFHRIARRLGAPNQESSASPDPARRAEVERVAWALAAAAHRAPWTSTCLIRALAGHRMLRRRAISSTLYLGLNPDGADRRALAAHAWLRAGSLLVTGGEEQAAYTPVACFAQGDRSAPEEAL